MEGQLIRVLDGGRTIRVDALLSPTLFLTLNDLLTAVESRNQFIPDAFLISIFPRLTESLRELFSRGHTHGGISIDTILVNSFGGASLLQTPGSHVRLPTANISSSSAAIADVTALGIALLAASGEGIVTSNIHQAIDYLIHSSRDALALIIDRQLSIPVSGSSLRYVPNATEAVSTARITELSRVDELIDVDAVANALRTSPPNLSSPNSLNLFAITPVAAAGEMRRALTRTPPSIPRGNNIQMATPPPPPPPPSSSSGVANSPPLSKKSPIPSPQAPAVVVVVAGLRNPLSRAEELQRMRAAKQAAAKSVADGQDASAITTSATTGNDEALLAIARKDAFEARLALKARHGSVNNEVSEMAPQQQSRSRGMQRTPPHPLTNTNFSSTPLDDSLPAAANISASGSGGALVVKEIHNTALALRAARLAANAADSEELLRVARIAAYTERAALTARASELFSVSEETLGGGGGGGGGGARISKQRLSINSVTTTTTVSTPQSPPQAQRPLPQTPIALRAAKQAEKAAAEEEALRLARIEAFKERQALKERFGR